jgi:hypothetical protein
MAEHTASIMAETPSGAMQVLTPAPRPVWRRLLAADPEALADHGPEWIDAMCEDGRYADASRLYEFPDGRRFVLPLTRRRGVAGVGGWLASHPPAWGIGGLVGSGTDPGVVAAVLADLRQVGAARTWVRPNPVQAAHWAAAAERQPGMIVLPRRAHVIDLTGGPDAVLARMPASTRRGLRVAARRGVRVEVDRTGRLLPVHQDLFQASLLRWAAYHHEPAALARWRAAHRDPPAKLQAIARHLGAALVVLIAYVDGRPAASNITLVGAAAHDTRAAIDHPVAGPVRAAELLQWRAIQLACEHGCRTHHLGETGASASLARFKERFGATPVDYAEYRLERLPYTRLDHALRTAAKGALRFRDTGP